jgi:hypothetical protein
MNRIVMFATIMAVMATSVMAQQADLRRMVSVHQ